MTLDDLTPRQTASAVAVERGGQALGAAVLLLRLDTREVVHVNTVAHRMASGTTLPATVEAWAEAAGLLDLRVGAELALEALRAMSAHEVQPDTGPILSLRTPPGEAPQALQLVALPLAGATGLEGHALLVLLPEPLQPGRAADLTEAAEAGDAALLLRERALTATALSFTLADARDPELPLTWVNPAFTAATGYTAAEAIGRNCRFLQGPETDPAEVARMREALREGRDVTSVLRNYRKDGTPFWNEVTITPVLDAGGELTHFVGVQADVTVRVESERITRQALEAEREARAEAESLSDRLSLLSEVGVALSETLDLRDALSRLVDAVVPGLADWAVASLLERDALTHVTARHRDGHEEALRTWAELQPTAITEQSATMQALRTRRPVLQQSLSPEGTRDGALTGPRGEELVQVLEELGLAAALVVPLLSRGEVIGTLALLRSSPDRPFRRADVDTASDLARTAALTLDNARTFEHARTSALTLQRSLLPELPTIPGLSLAATYTPSDAAAQIGGDWWDAFSLTAEPGEPVALAIGDVMGHDLAAAAAMGQLRSVLRTCAWLGNDPATVLSRMDRLVQTFQMAQMATCIYARLDPADLPGEGRRRHARLVWSNAGHLPPLLQQPDGTVTLLDDAVGVPIGVGDDSTRDSRSLSVPAGSTLLLYTDGLVESRSGDIDDDIRQLIDRVAKHDPADGPTALVDALVAPLGSQGDDDVAVLAVQVH